MLGYEKKHVLVIGGATGMGAAAAQRATELGAEVTVLDVAEVAFPVHQSIRIDLRSEEAVEATIERLDGPFDAVFSCAGVADGTPGVMLINFISQRRLIEGLLAKGALGRGSAVGMISSIGAVVGIGWKGDLPRLREFLSLANWKDQVAWVEAHKTADWQTNADSYMFSKRAMSAYVATQAFPLAKLGMRINAVLPGSVDTPLARANAATFLPYGGNYRTATGLEHLQPREVGDLLVFLCSPAASGVNGENIVADQGFGVAQLTGAFQG